MDIDFWYGKRVLVTGHTGFKGSWLCIWLQVLGAEVCGLALSPPTSTNIFEICGVQHGMRSCIGDIRDFDLVKQVVDDFAPEIIIHMAAQPLVRYSYSNPIETFSTNVMGTVNLLEAARKLSTLKALVNVTTDKCYENREWIWGYREDDPMGGHDPYSSSKGCSELVAAAYRRSYFVGAGIGIATARAGNVIGGGDWALDRLIPDILKSFEKSSPVLIRNQNSIRPWQHVLEPLSGYLKLAQMLCVDPIAYSGAWNFGPRDQDAQPVSWIVERMVKKWGEGASWLSDHSETPHEAHFLKLDISKARQILGWEPRWDLDVALDKTILWHKARHDNINLRDYSVQQISEYTSSKWSI